MVIKNETAIFVMVAIFLCIFGFINYANSLHAGFQFDDYSNIIDNTAIHYVKDVQVIWKADPTRFIPNLTFSLNYQVGKEDAFLYHVVNTMLHIICSFFVFYFVHTCLTYFKTNKNYTLPEKNSVALISALIFLCHPVQTEAVTYIVQRSTEMATIFYIAAVLLYVLFRIKKARIYYFSSLAISILGTITKPIIFTIPFMLLFIEFYFFTSESKKICKRLGYIIPFFITCALIPLWLLLWKYGAIQLNKIVEITRITTGISRLQYFMTQFRVFLTYIRLMFIPINQNFDYDFQISRSILDPATIGSLSALACLAFLLTKVYRRNKLVVFGIVWFFIALATESSFFTLPDVIFEHRLYLPMVGFSMGLSIFIFNKIKDKRKFYSVAAVILIAYTSLTIHRNYIWSDPERLWNDTIQKSPRKARPVTNLADLYLRSGQLELAELYTKKSIELEPKSSRYHFNLAVIYERQGKNDEALKKYTDAIDIHPKNNIPARYYFNLGSFYHHQDDMKKAEEYYKLSIATNERYADAYGNLGNLYIQTKQYDEAINFLKNAIFYDKHHISSHNGLASLYSLTGRYEESIAQYKSLINMQPDFILAYNNLGNTYVLMKNFIKAEKTFKEAFSINPYNADTCRNLANVYYGLGREKDARIYMQIAVDVLRAKGKGVQVSELERRYLRVR